MMTVKEVNRLTGVSVRALHYYDSIGLLKPARISPSGYRLYDEKCLKRLQQILLYRELEFSLDEIKNILSSPDFDIDKALEQQIELFTIKKEHFEKLIAFAERLRKEGGNVMDFDAFDSKKLEEYSKRAKEQWGKTAAYGEYEKKSASRDSAGEKQTADGLMAVFAEFGKIKNEDPASESAQTLVKKLQDYITDNYYTCTVPILSSLGIMYTTDEFAENIDKAGGEGTARFAAEAIKVYCR